MEVLRTWKRDGTQNKMDLRSAIANLSSRTSKAPAEIRAILLAGGVLETRLARFELLVEPDAIIQAPAHGKHKDIL